MTSSRADSEQTRGEEAMQRIVAAALAAFFLGAALSSNAGAEASEAWQFDGLLYIYLPTIGGTTTFPPPVGGSSVSVDAAKILDNLNMAFMGSLGVRKGPWGAFTDVMYMDLGNTKSATRSLTVGRDQLPVGASANATLDLKATVWTVAGSYRISDNSRTPVDVFAGARLLDIKESLRWQLSGNIGSVPLPDRAGNPGASLANWDGIIGVRGRYALDADQKWFIPYYLDFGMGSSDQTVQAVGGVGYAFEWGDVTVAWRYLDYKMKDSSKIESLNLSGPIIAAAFHW
jgi:hypothetical protein